MIRIASIYRVHCVYSFGLMFGLCILECPVFARPEWRLAKDIPGIIGIRRSELVVVGNSGTSERPEFKLYAPSIVPLSKTGQIKWYSDDAWRSEPIGENDQVIIERSNFGSVANRTLRLTGCKPAAGIKITNKVQITGQKKEAYFASCNESVVKGIPTWARPVRVDLKEGVVESSAYLYKYKTSNNMLFESVKIKTNDGSRLELARDADLLIRADVKNFFTMQFDSSDIESKMKSSRNESGGALATLGFYLNVLFFKISMDLDTDVRFFKDSAHIPMVLTMPIDARKNLHPKSGVLYSFVLSDVVSEDKEIFMPTLTEAPLPRSEGLKHCTGDICAFKLKMNTIPGVNTSFSMELRIPRKLVEFGMFPHFVPDVAAMSKTMKWSLPKDQRAQKRVGLYLEVSGLPEGEHPWEFWMDLGGDAVI